VLNGLPATDPGHGPDGLAFNEGTDVGRCRSGCRCQGVAERVLPNTMLVPTAAYDVLSHGRYLSSYPVKATDTHTFIHQKLVAMKNAYRFNFDLYMHTKVLSCGVLHYRLPFNMCTQTLHLFFDKLQFHML